MTANAPGLQWYHRFFLFPLQQLLKGVKRKKGKKKNGSCWRQANGGGELFDRYQWEAWPRSASKGVGGNCIRKKGMYYDYTFRYIRWPRGESDICTLPPPLSSSFIYSSRLSHTTTIPIILACVSLLRSIATATADPDTVWLRECVSVTCVCLVCCVCVSVLPPGESPLGSHFCFFFFSQETTSHYG